MFRSLNLYIVFVYLLNHVALEPWSGVILQEYYKYKYGDYWSEDTNSCIVADTTLPGYSSLFSGNEVINPLFDIVSSIQYCDGNYVINNKTLILPRNTMPICNYNPIWYDLSANDYKMLISKGFKLGNSTFDDYKEECLKELQIYSKSRFENMYGANVHEMMCMRYSEFLTVLNGLDPEIVELVEEIESQFSPAVKWNNSKQQAYHYLSSVCGVTNKGSCIELVRHMLDEEDNSVLNLLGSNIYKTPTTWLYADGIDIKRLHYLTETMGMTLETEEVDGIHYHHISPESPSGPFVWINPGLMGGKPE